jgi:tRNA pseudouridine13 synthase
MYKIKQTAEDFVVKEISNVKIGDKGSYIYLLLKKKDYTTIKAIEQIAEKLRLKAKFFGFAGTKDRRAVTEQLISIKGANRNKIEKIRLKDIGLKYLGRGENPISLGDLKGNEFVITIRNLTNKEINRLENKKILVPNYFGEQRFSRNNVKIGKSIIKKDFKKAAELVGIDAENNNYIGALRKINKKILRLYVHAYQSYLFNKTIYQYLKTNKQLKIPIVGFGTEIDGIKDLKLKKIIKNIIKQEKISLRDFIISSIPELSSEGTERELFVKVKFNVIKLEKDKAIVSFYLPKGSYATVVVDCLLNNCNNIIKNII